MNKAKKSEGTTTNVNLVLSNFMETENFVKDSVNTKGDTGAVDNVQTELRPSSYFKSKPRVYQKPSSSNPEDFHRKPPARFPRGSKGDLAPRGSDGAQGAPGSQGEPGVPGAKGTTPPPVTKGTTPTRTKGTPLPPRTKGTTSPPTKGTAKPQGVQCSRPESPPHGTVTFDGFAAEYRCDGQYKLSGSDTRHCGADGEWEGRTPYCSNVLIPALLSSIIVILVIGIVVGIVFVWRKLKHQAHKKQNAINFSQLKQAPDFTNDSSSLTASKAKTVPLESQTEDPANHIQNERNSTVFSEHVPTEISSKSNIQRGEESPGIYEYVEVKKPESSTEEAKTSESYQNSPKYVNTLTDVSSTPQSSKMSKKGQKTTILPVQSHYVNTQMSTGSEAYMEMGSNQSEPTNVYEPLEKLPDRSLGVSNSYDIPRSSHPK